MMALSRRKRFGLAALVVGLVLALSVGSVGLIWVLRQGSPAQRHTPAQDGNTVNGAHQDGIMGAAQRVTPSVVSIMTGSQASAYYDRADYTGAGTGIILSQDGYVITNKHVVEGADRLTIILADGTSHSDIQVVGADPLNDIAFVRINGVRNLTPAELGDSSTVRVGQPVVAVGNSLGQYQSTVTSGIISGKGRPLVAASGDGTAAERLSDLLQTDAAINPGNSGGPLVNLKGQVIGINTAIAARGQGLGFAIPINATKGMIKGLLASGRVERPSLGLRYTSLTPDIAKRRNLPLSRGALVDPDESQGVISGGPAARAGLRPNDIITRVNNLVVGEAGDLASLVAEYTPGDSIDLTVWRDGQERTVRARLAKYGA